MIEFILFHKPIAKKRPRFSKGLVYDEQNALKADIKAQFMLQMIENEYKALEGPIFAKMTIGIPMPKKWSQRRRKQEFEAFVITKPDNDNYEKFYFDCLNGIAFNDDAQIAWNETKKIYTSQAYVKLELRDLNG